MKRKWSFYGLALAYERDGMHYIVTFSRYGGKEICTITRLDGLTLKQVKIERYAYKMIKLHFNRCKYYHGSVAVDKVYYLGYVRITNNYSKQY